MRFVVPFGLLVAALGLSACSYPYDPPQLQTSQHAPGILELLPSPASTEAATRSSGGGQVLRGRLIATHGMCSHTHQENWVQSRISDYARALGAVPVPDFEPNPGKADEGEVITDRVLLHTPDGTFELVLLRWGSHVNGARARMEFDNYRAGQANARAADLAIGPHPERGVWSGRARADLMNSCLIDAVVYSGTAGNPIRHSMREAMCSAIGGSPGATTGGVEGAPTSILECAGGESADLVQTVLLAESLGSTIMLDAVQALDPGSRHAARRAVRGIYLLANQFPLLSEANRQIEQSPERSGPDIVVSSLGSLSDFVNLDAESARDDALPALHVVAITDPNDVLGSRIHPASFRDRAVVSNVLVSNAATILGLASNPLRAHSGWDGNATVFNVIARGLTIDASLR
jgi:hypothetical protein